MSAGQEIGSPIRENRTLLPAPLPPDEARGTLAAAAGVSTVGLRPPSDTPAAAFSSRLARRSHLDCRAALLRRRLTNVDYCQPLLVFSRDLLGREAGPTRREIPVRHLSPPGAMGSGSDAGSVAPTAVRRHVAAAASASPKRSGNPVVPWRDPSQRPTSRSAL